MSAAFGTYASVGGGEMCVGCTGADTARCEDPEWTPFCLQVNENLVRRDTSSELLTCSHADAWREDALR